MRDLYRSLLTITAAVLALWLILGFWPLSTASRAAISLLIILVCSAGLWLQWRTSQARAEAARDIADDNLPPEDFPGTVILACGDSAALFSAGTCHRETRQGWYLWVKDAEQLPLLAQHLSQVRPALVSQLSVLIAVTPEQHTAADDFSQSLRGWQRAIEQCRPGSGKTLPVWIVTWVSPPLASTDVLWFTVASRRGGIQVHQSGQGNLSLEEWARENDTADRLSRISQGLWLDGLLSWQMSTVDALLQERPGERPVMKPCAQGICLVPVKGVSGNLWQQHIDVVTALPPEPAEADTLLPLPECLLPGLPRHRGVSRRMVFWRYIGFLVGIFLVLAMLASWVNNQRLIRNIGDHLALYQHLSGQPVEPKLLAQQRLRTDGAMLDDWQRRGEPLRYRLGLYQGLRLFPPLEAAVNDWAPPPPPPPSVIKQVIEGPKIVRLDSMSLFDSGKAALKAGTTKILINSLVDIKAKPGWLIVVAGHTDNTGNPQLNQTLSLKRAEAVRNWMRDTGDVPQSCFAVQGFGQSRPMVANNTAEGRAANRRVEISLVPQADACQAADAIPPSSQDGDGNHEEKE